MMKLLFFPLSFFFLLPLAHAQESLRVAIGEEILLPRPQRRVWVEDPAVILAKEQGGRIGVRGLKEGASQLRLDDRVYNVVSVPQRRLLDEAKLSPALRGLPGLRLQWEGADLWVRGRLHRWKDWEILSARGASAYRFGADLSDDVKTEAEAILGAELKKAGLPAPRFLWSPGPELHLPSTTDPSPVRKLLGSYGIPLVKDDAAIDMAPTVRFRIMLAEVKKNSMMNLGIKWPDANQAQLLPNKLGKWGDVFMGVKALEEEGKGKILARPTLICRSGREAEFMAGGEFPIKIFNYKTQDVVWKTYGVRLKVKPKADFSGRMSLQLETEISSIDSAHAVDGIPGLSIHRVASYFDLSRPQTVVLSGLLKSEDSASGQGIPGLMNLPLLGPLFRSEEFRNNRSEFVILVRPEIANDLDVADGGSSGN